VTVRARALGSARVEVIVEDDGPGFDVAQLARIWDPFFSQRAGGTGLGLSIVRAVVEHHGGSAQAGNRERGAWVRVELPRRAATPIGEYGGAAGHES
jgi:signal transduction histidine kinase